MDDPAKQKPSKHELGNFTDDSELVSLNTMMLAVQGRCDPEGVHGQFLQEAFDAQRNGTHSPFTLRLLEFAEMDENPSTVAFALGLALHLAECAGPDRDLEDIAASYWYDGMQVDQDDATELLMSYVDCDMLAPWLLFCPLPRGS